MWLDIPDGMTRQQTCDLRLLRIRVAVFALSPVLKMAPVEGTIFNSGDRIRTCDLQVMSLTSYQTALPRNREGKYTGVAFLGQQKY